MATATAAVKARAAAAERGKARAQISDMQVFTWVGIDKRGVKIRGEQLSKNASLVKADLRKQGINPQVVKAKPKPLFGKSGKAIKGRDDASGGLVLHFDHDFLPGLTFRQDQKRFLRLLLAFDTVHFPVSDFLAGVDFRVALLNALSSRRPGGLLVLLDLRVGALLLPLAWKVNHFQGQEHALLDVGIQGRFTDRCIELDSLHLDFAQDGRRGISVFDDPAFNVFGQSIVLPDLQVWPLRGQVFAVCGFGYVWAIPFFFGPV